MKTIKTLTLLLLLLPTIAYTNISKDTTVKTLSLKDSIKDTTKVFSEVKIDSIAIDTNEYCFSAGEIKSIAEITLKYEELRRYSEERNKTIQDLIISSKKTENSYNSLRTDYDNLKVSHTLWKKGSFIVVGSITGIVIVGTTIHYIRKH